jgi:phosphoenolpyruvate carboxylase
LLETPGFIEFFSQATPIDAIENSRIGSRPARRSGKRSLEDLRAIPWVFAWNQSRFVLPGWYGLGTALEKLQAEDSAAFARLVEAKREHDGRWPPFHYLISNIATAWMMASPNLMCEYAALVGDDDCRTRLLAMIQSEHRRTGRVLEALYERPLAEARPKIQRAIALRDTALAPLHQRQLVLLRQWRAVDSRDEAAARSTLEELLLSINAIAAGLGMTG